MNCPKKKTELWVCFVFSHCGEYESWIFVCGFAAHCIILNYVEQTRGRCKNTHLEKTEPARKERGRVQRDLSCEIIFLKRSQVVEQYAGFLTFHDLLSLFVVLDEIKRSILRVSDSRRLVESPIWFSLRCFSGMNAIEGMSRKTTKRIIGDVFSYTSFALRTHFGRSDRERSGPSLLACLFACIDSDDSTKSKAEQWIISESYLLYQQRFMFQGDAIIQSGRERKSTEKERKVYSCIILRCASRAVCVSVWAEVSDFKTRRRARDSVPSIHFDFVLQFFLSLSPLPSLHSVRFLRWIREDLCVCDISCIRKKSARDDEERRWMLKRDYKWLLGELE